MSKHLFASLSVAALGFLAGTCVRQVLPAPTVQPFTDRESQPGAAEDGGERVPVSNLRLPLESSREGTPARAFHWSQTESSDYPTYIRNLRSIGCPEQTIRDIIQADVHQLIHTNRTAQNRREQARFYQSDYRNIEASAPEPNADDAQEQQLLEALLGAPITPEPDAEVLDSLSDRDLEGVAPERRPGIRKVLADFSAARQAILATALDRELTPEERAQLKNLEQERRRALQEQLPPRELGQDLAEEHRSDLQ